MDEYEIIGVVRDKNGTVSHCGFKGYGLQNVGLKEKLITEEDCSFFACEGEKKKEIYVRISPRGAVFLTTDPNGYDMDSLNFLPHLDMLFLRRLIEPVR